MVFGVGRLPWKSDVSATAMSADRVGSVVVAE